MNRTNNTVAPAELATIDSAPRPVVVRVREFAASHTVCRHSHRRAQLVYASKGVMTVTTDAGVWVVPPQRAVWVPGGTEHAVASQGALVMRNLYVDPDAAGGLPRTCCVVTVTPLMRELLEHAAAIPLLYDEDGPDGRLMAVVLDQIRALPVAPLHLPMPRDRRLRRIADALRDRPEDGRTLEAWAREAGASPRTLARLFRAETAMTFRQWRQQARLLEALRRLARGEPVAGVAFDLGYGSQSAFIAMFRKALGTTPGRYFG